MTRWTGFKVKNETLSELYNGEDELHLTLNFIEPDDELGRSDRDNLTDRDELLAFMFGCAAGFTSIEVLLYPYAQRFGGVWVYRVETDPRLNRLQHEMEEALIELGYKPSKKFPFNPHVSVVYNPSDKTKPPPVEDERFWLDTMLIEIDKRKWYFPCGK